MHEIQCPAHCECYVLAVVAAALVVIIILPYLQGWQNLTKSLNSMYLKVQKEKASRFTLLYKL